MHCFLGLLESAGNCILIDSSVLYISPIAAAPGSLYRIRQLAPTLLSTTVQVVESEESSLLRLTLSALVAVLSRSVTTSSDVFLTLWTMAICSNTVANFEQKGVADPGGVQGVQTPALLFRCPFLKRTYFENMSLRFLAEKGAS